MYDFTGLKWIVVGFQSVAYTIPVWYWTLLISEQSRIGKEKMTESPKLEVQKCLINVAEKCAKLERRLLESHSEKLPAQWVRVQ